MKMKALTGRECASMARKAVALAKDRQTASAAAERLSYLASRLIETEVLIGRPDMLYGRPISANGNGQATEQAQFQTGQAAKDMAEQISRPAAGTKVARINHERFKPGATVKAIQQAFRILGRRDAKVSELAKVLKSNGLTASNIGRCLRFNEGTKFMRIKGKRGWWRAKNIKIG